MFMTCPKIVVGDLGQAPVPTERVAAAYSQVRSAYGATALAMPEWAGGDLPALRGAASDIAASVVSELISDVDMPLPTTLIDCRSTTMLDGPSPTYRLAASCGLHRATCWSLSGLGGGEVGEAMLQLSGLGISTAVISAIQAIQVPDTRAIANGYPLGDAGAAFMLSATRPISTLAWRICGFAMTQLRLGESPEPHHFRSLAADACRSERVPIEAIRWCVAQHVSAAFLTAVGSAFPQQTGEYSPRPHPEVNFGCADVPLTIALSTLQRTGIGALVFGGRFGSLSLVLLDADVTPDSLPRRKVEYRVAQPADADRVVSFLARYHIDIAAGTTTPECLCESGTRAAVRRKEVLVAISASRVIGAARIYRRKKISRVSVYQFAVDEDFRGLHVIEELLRLCDDAVFEMTVPRNAPINGYLRSSGWTDEPGNDNETVWRRTFSDKVVTD